MCECEPCEHVCVCMVHIIICMCVRACVCVHAYTVVGVTANTVALAAGSLQVLHVQTHIHTCTQERECAHTHMHACIPAVLHGH